MGIVKHLNAAYIINRRYPVNYIDGQLDYCKKEFSYTTNNIILSEFKNTLISKSGCIYTDYFKIVQDSLKNPTEIKYAYLHLAKSLLFKKKIKLSDTENYLIAFDGYTDSHYHWFCDFLPRVLAIDGLTNDYVLILPYNKYVLEVGIKTLDLLQIRFKDIILIKEDEYFVCKKCFMISHPCISGRIDDILMKKVKHLIDKYIVDTNNDNISDQLLYVSRSKAKYRYLLNENEVIPILKEYGFSIINFEDYTIMDQVKLCANSKVMVGLHGAGLTNMIFMKEKNLVTEFRRNRIYHNQCYWHLADSLNLEYAYLFGEPDREIAIEGNGCNLTLPPKQLTNYLDWLHNRKA